MNIKKYMNKLKAKILKKDRYVSTRQLYFDLSRSGALIVSEDSSIKVQPMPFKDVNPAAVVNRLYINKFLIDLTNLDKKIKFLKKRKRTCIKAGITATQLDKSVMWLEARKKYKSHAKKFKWRITIQEKIQSLLEEYRLRLDDITHYQEYIPPEGLKEVDSFIDLFEDVTNGKLPVIKIIVPSSAYEKKNKERDPIILGESPFGNFWFVLGAWDKEVKIMHKLWEGLI